MPRSAAPASPKRRRSAFRIPSGTSGRCWSASCATTGSDVCADEIRDHLTRPCRQMVAARRDRVRRRAAAHRDRQAFRRRTCATSSATIASPMPRRWSAATRTGNSRAPSPNCARQIPTLSEGSSRPHGRPICFVMKGMTKTFPGAPEAGAQQHQPAILPRRQDRHRRPQRRRQVDADEDHGRQRQGILRARPGRARTSPSAISTQEPQLDPTKTVLENVKDGVARVADMVDRFNAISAEMGDPPGRHRFRRADGGDGRAPGEDRRGRRLDARQPARDRDGGAALPAGRLVGREPLGRREAPRRADPAAAPEADRSCCSTSRPTTSTPRASSGSKSISRNIRARAHDHPRPLLPRQCRQLDPRARSRKILPLRRQLLDLPREEGQAARAGRARGERAPEGDQATSSSGSGRAPRPARPSPRRVSGKFDAARRGAGEARPRQGRRSSSRCPSGSAARSSRSRASPRPMATSCCSRTCPSPCRRAASSASSAPTAPASRPCSS